MKTNLIIGTRQSLLALWQSNHIADLLRRQYPECTVTLKKIITKGDRILDVPLAKIGGKGLFTKELETALLEGEIDLAVHSLKDMPTVLPEGLCLTAVTKRANAGDAFVSNKYASIETLPDLKIVDLRGNVDTRLRKLDDGQMDAIILAAAGLTRLGYTDRIREIIPHNFCLPAVGQGALAIECRTDNTEVRAMLNFLNDQPTKQATDAERAFLGLIEGGCQVPIGVHAVTEGDAVSIEAIIASLDGSTVLRDTIRGQAVNAAELGKELGNKMLDQGGRAILAEIM